MLFLVKYRQHTIGIGRLVDVRVCLETIIFPNLPFEPTLFKQCALPGFVDNSLKFLGHNKVRVAFNSENIIVLEIIS